MNSMTTDRREHISIARVVRAFVEASAVVLGFGFALLLIGAPIVLIAHGVRAVVSWLAQLLGGHA